MKKVFLSICALVLGSLVSNADCLKRTDQFSSFTNLAIHDSYDVVLKHGSGFTATVELDKRVSDYCRIFVQGTTLVMDLDKKSFPSELKAELRQKNSAPISLNVVVTIPSGASFSSITLDQNAVLSTDSKLSFSTPVNISVSDNAEIRNIDLNGSEISVNASKNARVKAKLSGEKTAVVMDGNSNLSLNASGNEFTSTVSASSQLELDADLSKVQIESGGSAIVKMKGKAQSVSLSGKNFTNIDTHTATVEEVSVLMKGSTCTVSATKLLKIDISGGAKLVFSGTPNIGITKVDFSTVLPMTEGKEPAQQK